MKSFIYTHILQTDSRLAYTHMHMDHVIHQHTHTPKHTHRAWSAALSHSRVLAHLQGYTLLMMISCIKLHIPF